jgi:hypothetical protein
MQTHRYSTALPLLAAVLSPMVLAEQTVPAIHDEYNATLKAAMPLEDGWGNPPLIARTRVWWWWLNGNTDKPTITRDLEAMKAVGIGGANIIDAGGDAQDGNRRLPKGPDFGSPEWIALFRHAITEADRLGLEMGFNIQSGWNLGGPSVTPEESSKRVTFSRSTIHGGRAVDMVLPKPETKGAYYSDVRTLAVPLAAPGGPSLVSATASSAQPGFAADLAIDGDPSTFWVSGGRTAGQGPSAARPETLEVMLDGPVRMDGVEIQPRPGYGPMAGWIEARDGQRLASFKGDGVKPIQVRFTAIDADRVVLRVTRGNDPKGGEARNVQIAEVAVLSGSLRIGARSSAARGAHLLDQKAYYKYPGAFTAAESWHLLDPGPDVPGDAAVEPSAVLDITARMGADGRLRWQAPPGNWEILRFGSTLSGAHVSTHSENAGGLAIDYLDRATLDAYWRKVLDPILEAVKPQLGRSLRFLHTDSWELGPVNWTRRMPEEFKRLRGYDITPWLPVLAGRIVGSRTT